MVAALITGKFTILCHFCKLIHIMVRTNEEHSTSLLFKFSGTSFVYISFVVSSLYDVYELDC